jgi:hypothetical protein
MQARRSIEHGPEGQKGWSSVAVHLQPAEGNQGGFYLTLFADGRPPALVYLRVEQVLELVEMAASASKSDHEIWEFVARIPMEPLPPSRSLYPRLRALLIDFASTIRERAQAQLDKSAPRASENGSAAPDHFLGDE